MLRFRIRNLESQTLQSKAEAQSLQATKSDTVSASMTDPFLRTTVATLPSGPASNFSIRIP